MQPSLFLQVKVFTETGLTMQVLTMDEVMMVSGGDRGDVTAGGAVNGGAAGGATGYAIARGADYGMRAGRRESDLAH